jgi:hypothetical protein
MKKTPMSGEAPRRARRWGGRGGRGEQAEGEEDGEVGAGAAEVVALVAVAQAAGEKSDAEDAVSTSMTTENMVSRAMVGFSAPVNMTAPMTTTSMEMTARVRTRVPRGSPRRTARHSAWWTTRKERAA